MPLELEEPERHGGHGRVQASRRNCDPMSSNGFIRDTLLWAALLVVVLVAAVGVRGSERWVGTTYPGFLVLDNGVVASAGLAHWPDAKSVYQHEVVAVDGVAVRGGPAVRAAVAELAAGTPVSYRFRSDGREVERTFPVRRFERVDFLLLFGAYLLNALVMAAVGLGIRFLRRSHPLANATAPLLLVSAVWGLTGMDLYGPSHLFRLHALAEALLAPAFVAMALGFPEPAAPVRRHPGLLPAVWGVGLLFAVGYQIGLRDPDTYVFWHGAANLANPAAASLLVVSQVVRFARSRSFESRQRIKLLALGTALALTPPIVLALGSALSGGQVAQNAIAFTAFLFPLSLGYAVLRHNLLGVDLLIRRGLVYFSSSILITATYLAGSLALDRFTTSQDSGVQWAATFPALTALVLLPLRDRIQQWLDRLFFRAAYDFQRTVERASARFASVASLAVVAEELRDTVGEALGPASIEVVSRPSKADGFESVLATGPASEASDASAWVELVAASAEPWDLRDGGLLVPMRTQEHLVGFLSLGPRRDGRIYGAEDRRLLKVLANQAAVAIQNAYSLEAVRELNRSLEGKVDERTTKLADALRELREKNRQLEEISASDPVTGLRSRRFTCDALDREVLRAEEHGAPLSVLMIDLDRFKRVNDSYGHGVGDAALRRTADAIQHTLRSTDLAGRFGGEEFLVVLPDTDAAGACQTAERIRRAVEGLEIDGRDGQTFGVTVSIGVAQRRPDDDGVALIDRADDALYRAKHGGRNRVEADLGEARDDADALPADPAEAAARHAAIVRALPSAIEQWEIGVYFQPRWSTLDGRCVGAEALARWTSRTLGRVAPDEFIPVAEELGVVYQLGELVLNAACMQAGAWVRSGWDDFRISVNISALQLCDPGFPRRVAQALERAGLDPRHLELEITERMIVEPMAETDRVMREICSLGVDFSLDDFGTGFSSLSCLTTLPVSIVKLDRSLVQDVAGNPQAERLMDGTCSLAHSLGLSVVAEGVDDPDAMPVLGALGCDEVQGFALGEPMPGEQMHRFVLERTKRETLVPVCAS